MSIPPPKLAHAAPRIKKADRIALPSLHRQVEHAASGDVAELCMELVLACPDPWAAAQRLLVELTRVGRIKAEGSL